MFGDAALGETNLAMVATARSVGAAAKFTGSGGAIVALCPLGQQQEQQLQGERENAGRLCCGGTSAASWCQSTVSSRHEDLQSVRRVVLLLKCSYGYQ
jgi:glucuronokinase